jgi:hypothetical protein
MKTSDEDMKRFLSLMASIVAIAICGAAGVLGALATVRALGLDGVVAALVAVVIGVLIATLLWAGGVALLRSMKVLE